MSLFEDQGSVFIFNLQSNLPLQTKNNPSKSVTIGVTRIDKVKHLEGETCFRPANYNKRGKIAKVLINGLSKTYYKRLSDTPSAELMAGNLSHALTRSDQGCFSRGEKEHTTTP